MGKQRDAGMIIDVMHECSDGWHTFTSTQVPGLFMTGEQNDLEEMYDEIPVAIAALTKADFGKDVLVVPVDTYTDYASRLPASHQPVTHYAVKDLAVAA